MGSNNPPGFWGLPNPCGNNKLLKKILLFRLLLINGWGCSKIGCIGICGESSVEISSQKVFPQIVHWISILGMNISLNTFLQI